MNQIQQLKEDIQFLEKEEQLWFDMAAGCSSEEDKECDLKTAGVFFRSRILMTRTLE